MIEVVKIKRGRIIATARDPRELVADENCKYRIMMTGDSFADLMMEHETVQDNIRKVRVQATDEIERIKAECDAYCMRCNNQLHSYYKDGYAEAEDKYQPMIERMEAEQRKTQVAYDALHQEYDALKKKYDIQVDLNDCYRRRQIETMNAKRGLIPKKSHPGFVVQSIEQWTERVNTDSCFMELPTWKTVIQTPYDAKIKYEYQEKDIMEDLHTKVLPLLGHDIVILPVEKRGNQAVLLEIVDDNANYVYQWKAKANHKSDGCWELTLFSTKEFDTIPDYMLGEWSENRK